MNISIRTYGSTSDSTTTTLVYGAYELVPLEIAILYPPQIFIGTPRSFRLRFWKNLCQLALLKWPMNYIMVRWTCFSLTIIFTSFIIICLKYCITKSYIIEHDVLFRALFRRLMLIHGFTRLLMGCYKIKKSWKIIGYEKSH